MVLLDASEGMRERPATVSKGDRPAGVWRAILVEACRT